ncbi:MAG: HAD family hydrolase [Candidatus Heimdallarchaeota archaeon]
MVHRQINISKKETWLVAFDCDGTLTTSASRSSWQVVHKYFGTWKSIGKPALERFMKNEISYQEFCIIDAGAWVNRHEKEYQAALNSVELREGIDKVMSFFKQNGCILAIISMGLSDIVASIATRFNVDFWIANEIVRRNHRITGEVIINVEYQKKGRILGNLLNRFNISPHNSIAFGDSGSDISMLKMAGTSIAIEPSSSKVAEAADFVYQDNDLSNLLDFFTQFD